MSLWSEFYSGEPELIAQYLRNGDFNGLDEDERVHSISFSGGLMAPYLFPDDFDILIEQCDAEQGTSLGKFSATWAVQVWGGTDEKVAEYQAFILSAEANRSLAALSDDAIAKTAERLKANEAKSWEEYRAREKSRRWQRYLKTELALHALPIGLSMGVQGPDYPLWVRILVPIATFGPLWGVRLWLRHRRLRRAKEMPDLLAGHGHDWAPRLRDLRQFMAATLHEGRSVVYMWSL